MPKRYGRNIEVVDHAPAEELRSFNLHVIEEIDYVSDGCLMIRSLAIQDAATFIVASHVIEHVPELIGFIRSCEALLKETGTLVLAVP